MSTMGTPTTAACWDFGLLIASIPSPLDLNALYDLQVAKLDNAVINALRALNIYVWCACSRVLRLCY